MTDLARNVLLPVEEADIWLKHLETVAENRKRGAKRAAATWRAQHQQLIEKGSSEGHNDGDNLLSDDDDNEERYGVCGTLYEEETDEIEKWIACDDCGAWYHWECTNIMVEPEFYICVNCE